MFGLGLQHNYIPNNFAKITRNQMWWLPDWKLDWRSLEEPVPTGPSLRTLLPWRLPPQPWASLVWKSLLLIEANDSEIRRGFCPRDDYPNASRNLLLHEGYNVEPATTWERIFFPLEGLFTALMLVGSAWKVSSLQDPSLMGKHFVAHSFVSIPFVYYVVIRKVT